MTPDELRQQRLDKREAILVARINANHAAEVVAFNRAIEAAQNEEEPERWDFQS